MTEQALAIIERVDGTALEAYADREIVRELVSRLMSFHPAAKEVGEPGMLMAAQLAILMGASPLPGTNEIHIWKDNKGNITTAPGINYWKRRAQQQGGVWWDFEARPMTEAERQGYGLQKDEVGAICRGVRQSDIDAAVAKGIPWQAAVKAYGKTGVGVTSRATTSYGSYKEQKTGRPLWWTAGKRAETDCLKTLFPYIPGEKMHGGPGLRQVEDGTYRPTYDAHWAALDLSLDEREAPEEDADLDELNAQLGLGQPAEKTPRVVNIGPPWEEELAESQDAEVQDLPDSRLTDLRSSLESNPRPTFGTVASAAVASRLFATENKALEVLKRTPLVVESGATVMSGTRLSGPAAAVKLFDQVAILAAEEEE